MGRARNLEDSRRFRNSFRHFRNSSGVSETRDRQFQKHGAAVSETRVYSFRNKGQQFQKQGQPFQQQGSRNRGSLRPPCFDESGPRRPRAQNDRKEIDQEKTEDDQTAGNRTTTRITWRRNDKKPQSKETRIENNRNKKKPAWGGEQQKNKWKTRELE